MMRKKQGIKSNDKNPEAVLVKEKAFDGWVTAMTVHLVGAP